MSDGSRMKATVVSLTKKKGMSWGIADLSIVCRSVSLASSPLRMPSYHLLGSNLGLLVLARGERRAGHDGWADSRGRAESGPGEGAEEAGVHGGLTAARGSARCCGYSIGERKLAGAGLTYGTSVAKPGEMSGDGGADANAAARGFVVLDLSSAKARRLHAG